MTPVLSGADGDGVVAVGECMLEMSRDGAGGWRLGHGGDAFNTALYMARLGARVSFLTALGRDPFSDELRAAWQAEGLDTSLVLTDPDRLPGLYAIRTDDEGERSFFYWREASAARRLLALDEVEGALAKAAGATLLYLSGITLSLFDAVDRGRLVELAGEVRARGGRVAFDPNYRRRGWLEPGDARAAFEALAPMVSIALPTFADEAELHGDADPQATVERWRALGVDEIVVKDGPAGCVALTEGEPWQAAIPEQVPVMDTTGAGDAFNAAYLAARLRSASPRDAAIAGHRLAGRVIGCPGAVIPRERMP